MSEYYVYIMTNRSGTLYIGVTNDLMRRVQEHKAGVTAGFTSRYRMTSLVYFENGDDIRGAIEREKQLKGWLRKRKVELIQTTNPLWRDLSEEWYTDETKLGGSSAEGQILRSAQNDIRKRGRAAESAAIPTLKEIRNV